MFSLRYIALHMIAYLYIFHRAWKENLIKKVKNRRNIVEMNDDLGDLMYSKSDSDLQQLWARFSEKWSEEEDFLKYFKKEWMGRPG